VAEFQVAFTTAAWAENRNKGRKMKRVRRVARGDMRAVFLNSHELDRIHVAVTLRLTESLPDDRIRHQGETD
jgi:hypothetical protein